MTEHSVGSSTDILLSHDLQRNVRSEQLDGQTIPANDRYRCQIIRMLTL